MLGAMQTVGIRNRVAEATIRTLPTICCGGLFGLFAKEVNKGRTIPLIDNKVVIMGAGALHESVETFTERLCSEDFKAYNVLEELSRQGRLTVVRNTSIGTTDFSIEGDGLMFAGKRFRTA